MNKATLSILTFFIAFSSLNAFAQNTQISVENQQVQEEYIKELERETQEIVEYQDKMTQIQVQSEMEIMSDQLSQELVNQITVDGSSNYEYDY
jgi:hypothetical protein